MEEHTHVSTKQAAQIPATIFEVVLSQMSHFLAIAHFNYLSAGLKYEKNVKAKEAITEKVDGCLSRIRNACH